MTDKKPPHIQNQCEKINMIKKGYEKNHDTFFFLLMIIFFFTVYTFQILIILNFLVNEHMHTSMHCYVETLTDKCTIENPNLRC